MRALVFSDIHNNIENVRLLRESEENEFDAIFVAGDIGDDIVAEFYPIIDSFGCPAYCVYGNWDIEQPYRSRLSKNCRLIHHSVAKLGSYYITGFSGCPTHWGQNPIFLEELESLAPDLDFIEEPSCVRDSLARIKIMIEAGKRTLARNRELLFNRINELEIPQHKLVIMTHERLTKIADEGVSPLMHIFGHIHKHTFKPFKGTYYLNAAAVDNGSSEAFGRKDPQPEGYCRLTVSKGRVAMERRLLGVQPS